jgi:hypothetical protein
MKIILIVYSFLIVIGCKKNSNSETDPVFTEPNRVYISGNFYNPAEPFPKYWENGKAVLLPHGGDDRGRYAGGCSGIAVSGNDVYVCGKYHYNAAYWKNGEVVQLHDNISVSNASSIFISGNDVYVAGNAGDTAAYWKNGQLVKLSDSAGSVATGIAVSGNDIYVSGRIGNYAVYWKNGLVVYLTDGTISETAAGIIISGNDIYITGITETVAAGDLSVEYWRNGVFTKLTPINSGSSKASGDYYLAISNNDVYVATSMTDFSTASPYFSYIIYWKNGQQVTVNNKGKSAIVTGIAVLGNDVYLSGYEIVNSLYYAKYWRNGQGSVLSDGVYNESTNGIVVLPK